CMRVPTATFRNAFSTCRDFISDTGVSLSQVKTSHRCSWGIDAGQSDPHASPLVCPQRKNIAMILRPARQSALPTATTHGVVAKPPRADALGTWSQRAVSV